VSIVFLSPWPLDLNLTVQIRPITESVWLDLGRQISLKSYAPQWWSTQTGTGKSEAAKYPLLDSPDLFFVLKFLNNV
jgi:hypothetical protein